MCVSRAWGTSFCGAHDYRQTVTDVPGLNCYPCLRTIPVRFLTEARSAFEHRQRLVQVPSAEVEHADTPIGNHQAGGMIDCLGNVQPFLADGHPLGKRPHLRQAKGQLGTRVHGGKDGLTQALVAPLAL
jgi:hypothetical protein